MDSDLTTVAEAAGAIGVGAADPKLPRLIASASEAIRRYIGRPRLHYGAAIVEKLAGYAGQARLLGTVRLYLGTVPIVSVASVVLPDGTSLAPSDYVIEDPVAGILYRREGWPFTGVDTGGVFHSEEKSIVVTYAGGWVTPAAESGTRTLPYDLEHACLLTVVSMYRSEPRDMSITSESLGDYSVSYDKPDASGGGLLPAAVQALLATYRRLQ
jgi:hypothetical protein